MNENKTPDLIKTSIDIDKPNLGLVQSKNMEIDSITPNKDFLAEISQKISENKNKLFITLLGLGISSYVYKKLIAPNINNLVGRMIMNVLDINEGQQYKSKNPYQKFENYYSDTVKKILIYEKENLNKFTSIYELYKSLSNGKKEQITPLWIIFKFKVFLYFFCCLYSIRFKIIIKQIQALLLEKIKIFKNGDYIKISFTIQEEILKENEQILNDFIEVLYKKIENLIKPVCDQILINTTFTLQGFLEKINEFRQKLEEIIINKNSNQFYYKLFNEYQNKIIEKIEFYENKDFHNSSSSLINSSNPKEFEKAINDYRISIEAYIKFYTYLFDIFNSNIFSIILFNSFEFDFSIIFETFKLNFDTYLSRDIIVNNSLPIAKIMSFLMNIFEKILDEKNSIYFIKEFNGKKLNEELNNIYKYILE